MLFLHNMGSSVLDSSDESEIERVRVLNRAEAAFAGKKWDLTAIFDEYKQTGLTFDHQGSCGLPRRPESLVG